MSLAIELERDGEKAGHVCDRSYRRGNGCPLLIRTTSEDVMTAEVFGFLRRMPAKHWLRPLISASFPKALPPRTLRLHSVNFWEPFSPPRSRAIPEGVTEADVVIRHDDGALVIEAKYLAALATRTTHDDQRDQLARLIDVAWSAFGDGLIGTEAPRILLIGLAAEPPPLVRHYQDPRHLRAILSPGHRSDDDEVVAGTLSERLGYLSWSRAASILERQIADIPTALQWLFADLIRFIRHRVTRGDQLLRARSQLRLPTIDGSVEACDDASS